MIALEEVADENENDMESPRAHDHQQHLNDSSNHILGTSTPNSIDNNSKPKKKATKITEEEHSSVDRSRDGTVEGEKSHHEDDADSMIDI